MAPMAHVCRKLANRYHCNKDLAEFSKLMPAASRQGSILTLDKNQDPFPAKVEKACAILGIDLDSQLATQSNGGANEIKQPVHKPEPRAEFTMRWLLKTFSTAELVPGSSILHHKAWLLLGVTLGRTRLATTARLVKEFKLLTSIRRTLGWLHEHCHEGSDSQTQADEDSANSEEKNLKIAETSANRSTVTKKRKRGDDEPANPHGQTMPFAEFERVPIKYLYCLFVATSNVLMQLEAIANQPMFERNFKVEQLRFAMKSSAEESAMILGTSLYTINHLLQNSHRLDSEESYQSDFMNTAYQSHITSLVAFWKSQPVVSQGVSRDSNNHSFRIHCMIPSLQLLTTCGETFVWSFETQEVTDALHNLLIEHVIVPFQSEVSKVQGRSELESKLTADPFGPDLASTLSSYRFPRPKEEILVRNSLYETERSAVKTRKHLTAAFMSLLYRISIDHFRDVTPNQRRSENTWLEAMFIQLTTSAAIFLPPQSPIHAQKDYVRLCRWMLEHIVNATLRLGVPTLKYVLDQASGLFSNDDALPDWDLVSLCIAVDPDVFLISASSDHDKDYEFKIPNKYLSSLLSKLSTTHRDNSSEEIDFYDKKLHRVLLPLCDAFASARDFPSFLGHWQSQLDTLQRLRHEKVNTESNHHSIWEDNELFNHVASLVEKKLTIGQVDQILSTATNQLHKQTPNVKSKMHVSLARLVIIDCVCTGLRGEDIITKLGVTLSSVYREIMKLLQQPSLDDPDFRWRFWRVQATMTRKLAFFNKYLELKPDINVGIGTAMSLFSDANSWGSSNGKRSFEEILHAFQFILESALFKDFIWRDIELSPRQAVNSIIQTISNAIKPFCHGLSQDFFEAKKSQASKPDPHENSPYVRTIEALFVACISYMLSYPKFYSFLDEGVQSLLIEQSYWFAVHQRRSPATSVKMSMDYSSPWQILLQRTPNELGPKLAASVRDFQVQHYLKISSFSDAKYWEMGNTDYGLAFETVQRLPFSELGRKKRAHLANCILRVLLLANVPSLAQMKDHLMVLTRLISTPNRSMEVLTSAKENSLQKAELNDNHLILLNLTWRIDRFGMWSDEYLQNLQIMQSLSRIVVKYLFSSIRRQSSINYLEAIYGQLASMLKCTSDDNGNYTAAISTVIEIVLNSISQNRQIVPDSMTMSPQALDISRQHHVEIILRSIEDVSREGLKDPKSRHYHGTCLESVVGYSDLLTIHPRLKEITSRLCRYYELQAVTDSTEEADFTLNDSNTCSLEYLLVRVARLELALVSYDSSLHPSIAKACELFGRLHPVNHRTEKDYLFRALQQAISSLSEQSRKDFFLEFVANQEKAFGCSKLPILVIALVSLNDQETQQLRLTLSQMFDLLCTQLCVPHSPPQDSMLVLQCISIFLTRLPRLISTRHIECLLASISIKATSLFPLRAHKTSPTLYTKLCSLLTTLLLLHRPKATSRYHLLLPALQSLLRCLFSPYTSPSSTTTLPTAFTSPSLASTYARLLTTLADPTVSSVSSHRRLQLNDEVKKARSIAGQYLGYLVMEYCECLLAGRLGGEGMKERLEEGGWDAVLGVMTGDGMRVVNEGLGEGGREVWRGVYGGWKRRRGRG